MKGLSRVVVAFIILATLLSACAPAATQQPAQPTQAGGAPAAAEPTKASSSGEPAKLTWWVDTGGNAETANCVIEEAANVYNKTNKDNITVEGIPQANAWDAIRTAVSGGGGPDIVYTPGPSFVFEMAKAGQLLPLDNYATQLGWDKQFLPWALDLGKVDGKLYSIPHEIETMVLYYNKTLFEQKGWTPPKTMDEWYKLMAEVKKAGLIANAAGNAEWRPTDEHYVTEFLNQYAGPDKVYSALKGETPWTDPEFAAAIDLLNQGMKDGYWQGGLDRYYTAKNDEFLAGLGDGKAAMMVSGTWWMGSMANYFGEKAGNTNEWEWVPTPSKTGTANFDLGIGSTYSINAATKYPEAAAKFLTYFFSADAQSRMISKCGTAPAPVQIKSSDLQGIDARRARLIGELSEAAGKGQYGYTTWTFWPPKSDAYIYDEIEKVWAGNLTTQQYLEGLQKQFSEELKSGNIPPIPTRN